MTRAVALAALALLAGCGQKTQAPPNKGAPAGNTAVNDIGANAAETNAASSMPGGAPTSLPPGDAGLRFVGRWATTKENCASKPWVFTKDELTATDGPHCSIYKVSEIAGGYDLAVQCPAKKPDPTDLIKVRFAESAQAMLLESNAIEPMGLIYCGK